MFLELLTRKKKEREMNLTNIQILGIWNIVLLVNDILAFKQIRENPVFQVNQKVALKYPDQDVNYGRPGKLIKF